MKIRLLINNIAKNNPPTVAVFAVVLPSKLIPMHVAREIKRVKKLPIARRIC